MALLGSVLLRLVKGERPGDPTYIQRGMEEALGRAVSCAGRVQNIRGRGREGEPRDARGGVVEVATVSRFRAFARVYLLFLLGCFPYPRKLINLALF